MPIYEYRCLGCGAHTEKMQKVSDAPLEKCEACGGKLEKQVSLSGFQFKGAGWYVTDYAAKKSTATAEKSGATETPNKTEKTSAAESTADASGASNKSNDSAATVSKTETPAKKD